MQSNLKPVVALLSGVILFSATFAHAQSTLIASGSSQMANAFGVSTGPTALTVSWFVIEDVSPSPDAGLFTYGFDLYNPVGDVQPPTGPEPGMAVTVDTFTLSFNATTPGAVTSLTAPVSGTVANNGVSGIAWTFPAVAPGATSPLMAFQSTLNYTTGNASSDGSSVPPGPWSTVLGNPVPVPHAVPEPEIAGLFALGLALIPFRRFRK